MDLNYFIKLMKILLDGTKVSLRIFAITLIFAIPLGILVFLRNYACQKEKFVVK